MDFYICKTGGGEQLAGTQADAKALDREFVSHVVPTDKAGLMAYVNGLLARVVAPVLAKGAFAEEQEHIPVPPPPDKKAVPTLKSLTLTQIDEIMVRTTIEEAIWKMDLAGLDKLAPVIAEHRADLEAKAAALQPVAPAPRQRKRPV